MTMRPFAVEVRRFAPGDVDGWRAMNDVIRRLRDTLRPAGDDDLWIGASPTPEQIEERLGSDEEAKHVLFDWSMAEFVERSFRDERLQTAYLGQGVIWDERQPLQCGARPQSASITPLAGWASVYLFWESRCHQRSRRPTYAHGQSGQHLTANLGEQAASLQAASATM